MLTPRADAALKGTRSRANADVCGRGKLENPKGAAPIADNAQVKCYGAPDLRQSSRPYPEKPAAAPTMEYLNVLANGRSANGVNTSCEPPQSVHDGAKKAKKRKWRAAPEGKCWLKAVKQHQPWWQHAPSGRQRCTKVSPNEPTCSRVLSHMRSARACQRVKGHTPTIHTPVCMCMSSIEVGVALTTRVCPLSQQVLIPLHELTVEEKKSHRSAE